MSIVNLCASFLYITKVVLPIKLLCCSYTNWKIWLACKIQCLLIMLLMPSTKFIILVVIKVYLRIIYIYIYSLMNLDLQLMYGIWFIDLHQLKELLSFPHALLLSAICISIKAVCDLGFPSFWISIVNLTNTNISKKLSYDYNFLISIAIDVYLIKIMNSSFQDEVLCNLRS